MVCPPKCSIDSTSDSGTCIQPATSFKAVTSVESTLPSAFAIITRKFISCKRPP